MELNQATHVKCVQMLNTCKQSQGFSQAKENPTEGQGGAKAYIKSRAPMCSIFKFKR